MRRIDHIIPKDFDGTVRDFARKRLLCSASFLTEQRQLENGILINDVHARTVDKLTSGDRLTFILPDESAVYEATESHLDVLYEDEDYIVIDKPFGMPVHPSPGHDNDSLLNAVAFHYKQTGETCAFRPLYRLDKDTSGALVIAKHRAAASAAIEKEYFAVCEGELSGSGRIDAPIGLKEGSKITRECGHGQPAVTDWSVLGSQDGHSLVALKLKTGRTHQIRVHMAYIGHPLAGDDMYGGSLEMISRQALHCGIVHISCPLVSFDKTFVSPLPKDITDRFPWINNYTDKLKEGL